MLVNHYDNFLKGGGKQRAKRFLGEGLLLSEGDLHRRQRRLAQPAFHRGRLISYADEMVASAERCSARWQHAETLDIWREMLRLTLAIVGKTIFNADVESKDDMVGQAMKDATLQYRAFKLPFAFRSSTTGMVSRRILRESSETRAVNDRAMTTFEQSAGRFTDVEFRAGSRFESGACD